MLLARTLRAPTRTIIGGAARVRTMASGPGKLSINASRINEDLAKSCQWGSTPDGGMSRLTLNADDKKVRDWFVAEVQQYGCNVTVDSVGNIFAVRPGTGTLPPIAMGSHLDTQPAGGKYDGIVGVHSALEVLKTLHENKVETHAPVAVVNWTNEEGARWSPAMLGSGVWAGEFTPQYAYDRVDAHGAKLGDALDSIGYKGSTPASWQSTPLSAHFEVHIEQGPVLEKENKPVGVVTGVQAISWHTLTLTSTPGPSHTGTTPYASRSDALLAFAALTTGIHAASRALPGTLASVCVVKAAPQSINTLVNTVEFSVDARAESDELLRELERRLREVCEERAGEHRVRLAWDRFWNAPMTRFDGVAVGCVRDSACAILDTRHRDIVSGAGHDSVYTARRVPTAMIFIRCKDGVSHHPSEFASAEDIASGAQVLLGAVLQYDSHLKGESR